MDEKNFERWADILPELYLKIVSNLEKEEDRIKLSCACKRYRSLITSNIILPPESSTFSQSPVLMFSNDKFYHPIYNTRYQNSKMMMTELEDLTVQCSNNDWFLVFDGWDMLFVNPVTGKKVADLACWPGSYVDCYSTYMQFTSVPTSPDYTVITVGQSESRNIIKFDILRRKEGDRDHEWCTYDLAAEGGFLLSPCNPIVYNGHYYCLGNNGNFLKFDVNKIECYISDSHSLIKKKLNISYTRNYLVESNGDLLAVFVARDGLWVGVFRLNVIDMVFEEIEDLGDTVLYLSNARCYSQTVRSNGVGNKIYLPIFHGKYILFYSLANKNFQTCAKYTCNDLYGGNGNKINGDPVWINLIQPMIRHGPDGHACA